MTVGAACLRAGLPRHRGIDLASRFPLGGSSSRMDALASTLSRASVRPARIRTIPTTAFHVAAALPPAAPEGRMSGAARAQPKGNFACETRFS